MRYTSQFKKFFKTDIIYFNLYKSGFQVFENYPILGVGNKNYRVETCKEITKEEKTKIIIFKLIHII